MNEQPETTMIPEYITIEQVKQALATLGLANIPRPQHLEIDRTGIRVIWIPDGYQLRVESSVFIPIGDDPSPRAEESVTP